jgi:hypothetical protein
MADKTAKNHMENKEKEEEQKKKRDAHVSFVDHAPLVLEQDRFYVLTYSDGRNTEEHPIAVTGETKMYYKVDLLQKTECVKSPYDPDAGVAKLLMPLKVVKHLYINKKSGNLRGDRFWHVEPGVVPGYHDFRESHVSD